MKALLTVCLLIIAMPVIAGGQPTSGGSWQAAGGTKQEADGSWQTAVGRTPTKAAGETPAGPVLTGAQRRQSGLIGHQVKQSRLTRQQIKEAEKQLAEMGYWTGPVDGVLDAGTRAALIAFQKWSGRAVTGRLTIDELEAIRTSADSKQAWPKPREVGYAHVEVDLDRQVLMIVNGDTDNSDPTLPRYGTDSPGVRVLPVSTGHGKEFIDEGQTSVAYTPRGRFVVYDKTFGWENGALGSVYYANYISGGVAIHGSLNVPAQPASHGCIRIPMFAAREVSKLLKVGTIVLVYDKVSFVSAKDWVENPELKQAALLESMATSADYADYSKPIKSGSRPLVIKKGRSKVIRA